MSEEFSHRLADAIAKSGRTQAEIATISGITAPYLSDLKKGKKENPSREVVAALANCLGVSISWLLSSESESREATIVKDATAMPQANSGPGLFERLFVESLKEKSAADLLDMLEKYAGPADEGDADAEKVVRLISPHLRNRISELEKNQKP